jgi:hypothetical protein
VRRYQLHLAAGGVGVPTINQTVSTLRFFFRVTLKRHEIVEYSHVIHEPRKLPVVLSPEEVARLLDCRTRAQVQGGAERGLWRRPARHRGDLAQNLRHRQQADDHPRRAGQRRQGP